MYSYSKIEALKHEYKTISSMISRMEKDFPNRHFTMDGHLIGSIGECMAAYYYNIDLAHSSQKDYDGIKDGIEIQIKTTQRSAVLIHSKPEHLIVLKLLEEGDVIEVFNGPGDVIWSEAGKKDSHGYYHFSLRKLVMLNSTVPDEKRIADENGIKKMFDSTIMGKKGACHAFDEEDPQKAYDCLSDIEPVKEYGRTWNGKRLYICDTGERTLCRCKICGGYVLVQASEYHNPVGDDTEFYDYIPVSDELEAEEINDMYDGESLARKSKIRYLQYTHGKAVWSI